MPVNYDYPNPYDTPNDYGELPSESAGCSWDLGKINWGGMLGAGLGAGLNAWGKSMNEYVPQETNRTTQYPKWADKQRKMGIKEVNAYGKMINEGPVPMTQMEGRTDADVWGAYNRGGYFAPWEQGLQNQFLNQAQVGYKGYFPEQDWANALKTVAPMEQQSQTDYMRNMANKFPQLGTRGGEVGAAASQYNDMMAKVAGMKQGIYSNMAQSRQEAMKTAPQMSMAMANQAQNYGINAKNMGQWMGWASVPRTREQQMLDWTLGQRRITEEMRRAWAQLGYGHPVGVSSVTEGGYMEQPWYAGLLSGLGGAVAQGAGNLFGF